MGKGSKRRPCLTPRWLEYLRYALAYGEIDMKKYDEAIKEHEDQ